MERAKTIRVESTSLHGKDSFVELRKLTWGEQKALQKQISALAEDDTAGRVALMEQMIVKYLVGWNWKDGDEHDLPIPKSVDELDALYSEDIQFLSAAMKNIIAGTSEETRKN